MAIVVKTMEEIMEEMTPERIASEKERLKNHIDEYDVENPPLTKEELSRFRHHKYIPPEIEIMARVKVAEAKMKTEKETNNKKPQNRSGKDSQPRRAA